MRDLEERLARCFAAVFPGLDADEIRLASADGLTEWDSLASLTLVAVIEEEFEVRIDELDFSELGSYGALRDYVAHLQGSEASR